MKADFSTNNLETMRMRRTVGLIIGFIHLPIAAFSVLSLLAEASRPIAGPDQWPLAVFLVTMFPLDILACVGAFTNPFTGLALVPLNSILWGYAAGWLWQRIFRP